jgi:SAM-dependent methyltransferase
MDESLLLSFADIERGHWWFVVRRAILLDAVRSIAPPPDAHIVEVGCGTGGFMTELAGMLPLASIAGVEPNDSAAAVARSRGCSVTSGAFDPLPDRSESVDLLIALDVLEHCADDTSAIREAWRVLRPGGVILLTVPALPSLWSEHDAINEHHRRYVRASLARLLDEHGFVNDRLTYFNSVLLPLGYASRWVSRLIQSRATLGVSTPPRPVNAVLKSLFGTERHILRHANLPVGMSLLAVAHKPRGE